MRTLRLLPVLALTLVAADEPDPAPEVPPDDGSRGDTLPTSDTPAPPAEPGSQAEPGPQAGAEPPTTPLAPDAPATPGATMPDAADARLARCTELLAAGDWLGALTLAIPSITDYPERAASFEAVAKLATDQIARAGAGVQPLAIPAPTPSPGTGSTAAAPGSWRGPVWVDRPHPGADDPREGFLFGFDVGLTSGARVEWKAKGRTVDGVGFQASLGTVIYSGLYLMPATQVYVDFASRSDWQFETSLGLLWYSGSAYPLIGVGAQWDPPRPIQVNLGIDVGIAVMPDISVGFLW